MSGSPIPGSVRRGAPPARSSRRGALLLAGRREVADTLAGLTIEQTFSNFWEDESRTLTATCPDDGLAVRGWVGHHSAVQVLCLNDDSIPDESE